jgi:hypothetical protein
MAGFRIGSLQAAGRRRLDPMLLGRDDRRTREARCRSVEGVAPEFRRAPENRRRRNAVRAQRPSSGSGVALAKLEVIRWRLPGFPAGPSRSSGRRRVNGGS